MTEADATAKTQVRFTLVLPAGSMAQLAWIRLAIAGKLGRDGF